MENNIKKRETSSETNIDGRTFLIESYDPLIGNYILMQILTFVLPMGLGDKLNQAVEGSETILGESQGKRMMGKKEFIEFQKDVLSTVYEKFETGQKTPVIRENGTYGISDISVKLFIRLIISSLAFNFGDFFGDGELGSIITAL